MYQSTSPRLMSDMTEVAAPAPEQLYAPAEPSATTRSTAKDGLGNRLQFAALTHFGRGWAVIGRVGPLRRAVNRRLIDSAIAKLPPRPDPFSTWGAYTSWPSLTDRRYDGRHLGPTGAGRALPEVERVAALFERSGPTRPCEKSTVAFAYFAQWFTDGFLRSDRGGDPRRNESTHEIDLLQIYGPDEATTSELRATPQDGFGKGRLRSQMLDGEEYPPYLYRDGISQFPSVRVALQEHVPQERVPALFAIGTDTGNGQIGHTMMNTLFLREHNRIAGELEAEYPGWDDERVFQTARMILTVILIRIVVEEYINHIAPYRFKFVVEGLDGFQSARWMRTNRMAAEFNLLYRWHSLIPSKLVAGGELRPVADTRFNPALVVEHGLGRLFEEASQQPAGRIGLFNTDQELLHVEQLSIAKGRTVQLRSYNDYREHCKFPRVTAFDQITADVRARDALRDCYGTVEDIEFYVGLFAEDPRPGSALGSLTGRMVGIDAFSQALTNPLLAPQVFDETTFSPLGWHIIKTTRRLSDLVNRNVPGPRPYRVTMTRADWVRR
jgi:prostaglandin-endoperoxide synthase 2